MSQVLNQTEVESLLKGIEGQENEEDFDMPYIDTDAVIPFDLTAPNSFNVGSLPMLETILDRFASLLGVSLSGSLGKEIDVSLRSTESIKYGDFLKTLPIPTYSCLFRSKPLEGIGMICLETRLVLSLIDLTCGGNGSLEVRVDGIYSPTPIQLMVMNQISRDIIEDLHFAWQTAFPVRIEFSGMELNPVKEPLALQSDWVIISTFDVEIWNFPQTLSICLPYNMIEPLSEKLNLSFFSRPENIPKYETRRRVKALQQVTVDIKALAFEKKIKMADLLRLQSGDLILADQMSPETSIEVNNLQKFRGELQQQEDSVQFIVNEKTEYLPGRDVFGTPTPKNHFNGLEEMQLQVRAEVGRKKIAYKDVHELGPGSIIELDKAFNDPYDLFVEDVLYGKGEIVVIKDNLGFKYTGGIDSPINDSFVNDGSKSQPKEGEVESLQYLYELDAEILADHLYTESNRNIAALFTYSLNYVQAAVLLKRFPSKKQSAIIQHMINMKELPVRIIVEIEQMVFSRINI